MQDDIHNGNGNGGVIAPIGLLSPTPDVVD